VRFLKAGNRGGSQCLSLIRSGWMTSGLEFNQIHTNTIDMQSNDVVIQTLTDGESRVYQAGRYCDRVVRTAEGLRYQSKGAIYDTSRVQTMLVTPV